MQETPQNAALPRMLWADVARGFGILLVIYGHFIERLSNLGYQTAFLQYKFIYAFHVPLFFWLAGYIQGDRPTERPGFLKQRVLTRVVPALFFNLLAFPFFILKDALDLGILRPGTYVYNLLIFLRGYPAYNSLMWFVVCLFTVECLHFLLARYTRTPIRMAIGALAAYLLGMAVLARADYVEKVTGVVGNFWYIQEALIALAFYLAGRLGRRVGDLRHGSTPWWQWAVIGVVMLAATLATFNLNTGPFTSKWPVVVMTVSRHGNPVLFPLTALTGILTIVALARLTPPGRALRFIGENTLILLGINSLFHAFINKPLAQPLAHFVPDAHLAVLLVSVTVTLLSVAVSIPIIYVLNRYVPQLIGKPKVKGPWLPKLM